MRRISVDMPNNVDDVLTEFADANNVSKGEALRRAIALLALARKQHQNGKCLAIAQEVGEDKHLEALGKVTGV